MLAYERVHIAESRFSKLWLSILNAMIPLDFDQFLHRIDRYHGRHIVDRVRCWMSLVEPGTDLEDSSREALTTWGIRIPFTPTMMQTRRRAKCSSVHGSDGSTNESHPDR